MSKVKFISSPGYIYDLMFVFLLHFNRNLWPSNFINYDKINGDSDFYNRITSEFGEISEDLLIFFYMKNDSKSFLMKYYFHDYNEQLICNYNFDQLRDRLSNYDELVKNLYDFYFPEVKQYDSLDKISDVIDSSGYPDIIKHRLSSFFIKPTKTIQKLIYELISKETLLSKYYEKNYKVTLQTQENFNFEDFANDLKNINGKEYTIDHVDTIYVSICLVAKNVILENFLETSTICVIGFDYDECIKMLLQRKIDPKLDVLGKVLSEKNRLEILEMLTTYHELSTSDIAKKLSVSINAAYYHLDMMLQANMLHSRNEGRAVYYCINKRYFINVGDEIKKYGQ